MNYTDLNFNISNEVLNLGLRGAYFTIGNIVNKESDTDFEGYKEEVLRKIKEEITQERISNDPILLGFKRLHERVERTGKNNIASPENLLNMFMQHGRIPQINLLVDIYNLISLETKLAIGAHDISNIVGKVNLKITNGSEKFWPLGSKTEKGVSPGEYAYVDDNNDVLCRLEVRQVEKTKVTLQTTQSFYIVQGNLETEPEYIVNAAEKLINLTTKYCGGDIRFLYTP